MNIENCRLTLLQGGSGGFLVDDPGMVLAAASRGAMNGRSIASAIASLVASGAIVTLDPLVVDGGHVDWTPFFLDLMARGDLGAAAEVRRRAEDTSCGGETHWVEICAALAETPFEFHGANLDRRERPYADLWPSGEYITDAIRPFIPGEFAQPVAQVKKSSGSVKPDASTGSEKKAVKKAAAKRAKKGSAK